MPTLKERLERALENKQGATKASLARHCGITKTSVSGWFSGKTKSLDGQNLIRAAAYLGVRPEWLASGRGSMLPFGAPATDDVALPVNDVPLSGNIHTRRLPLIRWEQVGDIHKMSNGSAQTIEAIAFIESPFESSPDSYLLELGSESMLPEYRMGEIIQVDPAMDARNGDDVIVLLPNGRSLFRRLIDGEDGRLLQALNPQWPDRLSAMPEGSRIIGVVVGSWMTRRK